MAEHWTSHTNDAQEHSKHQRQASDRAARVAWIRAIAADIREAMDGDRLTSDHNRLYDHETGLPI